jgi:uncharacterized protein YoaH (UPF0181 family)
MPSPWLKTDIDGRIFDFRLAGKPARVSQERFRLSRRIQCVQTIQYLNNALMAGSLSSTSARQLNCQNIRAFKQGLPVTSKTHSSFAGYRRHLRSIKE